MVTGLNKDSLKRIADTMPPDTARVQLLILLGQQYENSIPDSALYYYREAGALSARLHYPRGRVKYISNYTAVLNMQGKFDESLELNLEAVRIAERHQLKDLYIKALFNTGAVYQYKENYDSAVAYYLKALPALEQTGNLQMQSLAYGNLCGLYRNLGQAEKAVSYARQSLACAEKDEDIYATGQACNNLGIALEDVGRSKEAIPYLNRAYAIGKQTDNINMQETALINMGGSLIKTRQPDRYIASFRAALPLADSLEDVYGKVCALHGIGLGLFNKKAFKEAEAHLKSAIAFARDHEMQEEWSEMLLLMSDVQIALGNLETSELYRSRYDSVRSLIMNESIMKNVQVLETKYEVERKQSEILRQRLLLEQKDRETLRQRLWLVVAGGGILLLSLLLFLGYRYYRQRQELHAKALQAAKTEQENIRLKSVLEGQQQERQRISQEMHDDMGAGLTSMLFLSRAVSGQDEVAGKLRNTAAELVRKMNEIIWAMNHEQDTLDSLIAYLRINIAEALDNAGIDYHMDITEPVPEQAVGQEFRRNIFLVAREAVHNIIRHSAASRVQVQINIGKELKITIADNGKGLQEQGKNRFGNGIGNMKRRMAQVHGSLLLESGPGTRVELQAPLPV